MEDEILELDAFYELVLVDPANVIQPAVETFGKLKQYTHCVEEMAEAIVAIMQATSRPDRANDPKTMENLVEELADARLMIDCAIYVTGREAVEDIMQQKIKKMFKQIEAAKQNKLI